MMVQLLGILIAEQLLEQINAVFLQLLLMVLLIYIIMELIVHLKQMVENYN